MKQTVLILLILFSTTACIFKKSESPPRSDIFSSKNTYFCDDVTNPYVIVTTTISLEKCITIEAMKFDLKTVNYKLEDLETAIEKLKHATTTIDTKYIEKVVNTIANHYFYPSQPNEVIE